VTVRTLPTITQDRASDAAFFTIAALAVRIFFAKSARSSLTLRFRCRKSSINGNDNTTQSVDRIREPTMLCDDAGQLR